MGVIRGVMAEREGKARSVSTFLPRKTKPLLAVHGVHRDRKTVFR